MEGNSWRGCSVELGSITQAMRAQKALAEAAIPSRVIKTEGTSRRGCAYGLSFSCEQEKNVRYVLTQSRISVKQWNGVD